MECREHARVAGRRIRQSGEKVRMGSNRCVMLVVRFPLLLTLGPEVMVIQDYDMRDRKRGNQKQQQVQIFKQIQKKRKRQSRRRKRLLRLNRLRLFMNKNQNRVCRNIAVLCPLGMKRALIQVIRFSRILAMDRSRLVLGILHVDKGFEHDKLKGGNECMCIPLSLEPSLRP